MKIKERLFKMNWGFFWFFIFLFFLFWRKNEIAGLLFSLRLEYEHYILEWKNKSLSTSVMVKKDVYTVDFKHNSMIYTFAFHLGNKGIPPDILSAAHSSLGDITSQLRRLAGPSGDFFSRSPLVSDIFGVNPVFVKFITKDGIKKSYFKKEKPLRWFPEYDDEPISCI